MLVEQQIAERRERAQNAVVRVEARPAGGLYGDYRVQSASGKTYRVAMRGPGLFENYCSCPDFAVNTLGTCKHIEALLLQLRRKHGTALGAKTIRAHARFHLPPVWRDHRDPAAPAGFAIGWLESLGRRVFRRGGTPAARAVPAFRRRSRPVPQSRRPGGHIQRCARIHRPRKRDRRGARV